jgi:signal transduction histidine kinase/ligand-binding sensor domain-containing protein/ActR/RegA family two-component response regulator
MKKIFLVSILFFQSVQCIPQQIPFAFERLSTQNGLSNNWIRCIYQDDSGYLWFGTGGNGLNKYDGYKFTVYKSNPRIKNSLSNNSINAIFEDHNRNLWIGTQFGLNLYDRENDCFIVFPAMESLFITGFYETGDGKLFVVTVDNVYEINLTNHSAMPFCAEIGGCLQGKFVDAIVEDIHGNLWLGSTNGLYLLDTLNKTFTIFKHDDHDPTSISDNQLESITKDSKGRLWIGTVNNGLCLMKYRNAQFSDPYFINFSHNPQSASSITSGIIWDVLDDGEGSLWIGTENGGLDILDLSSFEKGLPVFIHHLNNEEDETSLANNSIYSLLKDNQGTIWIGTYAGGLNYYNELLYKFYHFKIPYGNNIINVIYKENNNLWLGTEGGLYFYNNASNQFEYYKHDADDRNSIGEGAILSIFEDSRKNIWIGTWAGGLNLFNRKEKKFTRFLNDEANPNSIGGNNVFDMVEDGEGYLWIACMNGGLNRYDYRTNTFKAYRVDFQAENSISGDWVRTLFINSYNEFWISTTVGVDLFNRKTERFIHFTHDPNDSTSISYNGAIVFFEDSKRNFWLGTEGGLNSFMRKDSSFICYYEENGLPDNSIKGICEDEHGNLWLSTNKGISKFTNGIMRPDKPVFKNFNTSDGGLQGNEFKERSYFKDSDGYIYFGGTNGYNVFHPDSMKENSYVPPVLITDFLLVNKPVGIDEKDLPLNKRISLVEQITLSYKNSSFIIQFLALNYINPEKNQYKYKLEGYDQNWIDADSKRSATYTNINPGKYIFYVKGSNNDGVWCETPEQLTIIIRPPWWGTILFKIALAAVIILLGLLLHFARISYLKKLNLQLEQKVNERTNELSEINTLLEEKQEEITTQNNELQHHRNNLEQLIEERTSELFKAKVNAEESDRLKTSFLANISHEIRTPMNAIYGFSGLLSDKTRSEEARDGYLNIINKNCESLLFLIDDIVDISLIESNHFSIENAHFEVNPILIKLERIFQLKNSKTLDFEFVNKNDKEKLVLFGDKVRFHQILSNLLSNAFKYTESGQIKFGYDEFKTHVRFYVSDTGIGIEEKEINNIFTQFYKVENNPNKLYRGTGIGLAISKKVVELMGGEIWVESLIGKGSVFYFILPKLIQDSNVVKPVHTTKKDKLRLKGVTLLIAEDDPTSFEMIKIMLKSFGAQIIWAKNGKEAIEYIRNCPKTDTCIVLMDIKMSVMDGYEATRQIKIINNKIPIIAVTAYAQKTNKKKILQSGFDDYVSKPIKLETLLDVITRFTLPSASGKGKNYVPMAKSQVRKQ